MQATKFSPICPQNAPASALTHPQSEDCLGINIWQPANTPDAALPVLVNIHGGAFTTGSTAEVLYKNSQHSTMVPIWLQTKT